MNIVALAGTVVGDIKTQTAGKTEYVIFDVSVKEWGKDGVQHVEYPVIAFGKQAESTAKYFGADKGILINGKLRLTKKGMMVEMVRSPEFPPYVPKEKREDATNESAGGEDGDIFNL